MNKRALGVTLSVIGVVVLLVALGADLVGLGSAAAFGPRQAAGAVAGATIAVVGAISLIRR